MSFYAEGDRRKRKGNNLDSKGVLLYSQGKKLYTSWETISGLNVSVETALFIMEPFVDGFDDDIGRDTDGIGDTEQRIEIRTAQPAFNFAIVCPI